jgi:hypothetical protein
MSTEEERIEYAISRTEVVRPPKQTLSTFGTTNIYYYLITEPAYREVVDGPQETVVREGRVRAERPKVVTPSYLIRIEGFSEHARRYLEMVAREYGPHAPGLFYSYKNEPRELNIVSSDIESVVRNIAEKIDKAGDQLATIIKGVDELWDVSLLKFIYDMTRYSMNSNVLELARSGLLTVDPKGIPMEARQSIERLFDLVKRGEADPSALKIELDRWGLFEEYEDRFLQLFKR